MPSGIGCLHWLYRQHIPIALIHLFEFFHLAYRLERTYHPAVINENGPSKYVCLFKLTMRVIPFEVQRVHDQVATFYTTSLAGIGLHLLSAEGMGLEREIIHDVALVPELYETDGYSLGLSRRKRRARPEEQRS